MIIGLTGGIATGKSTITRRLQEDGYIVIDADEMTAQLYQTNLELIQAVGKIFPTTIIENKINRHLLAQEIANNPHLLSDLEAKTHPTIMEEIKRQVDLHSQESKPIILAAPILFESGLNTLCDRIICLYTSVKRQWERARQRPNMTHAKFEALLKRQWSNHRRMQRSDINISTFTSIEKTYAKVLNYIQKYCNPNTKITKCIQKGKLLSKVNDRDR